MFINGTLDTSLDSAYLATPEGIKWPTALGKLITEYETAWLHYDATQVKLIEAMSDQDEAEAADTRALIEAVQAGDGHPGHQHTNAARDNLNYQFEATRLAARKADALSDQIRAAAKEQRASLTKQAVALERQALNDFTTAYAEAQAIVAKAQLDAQIIGTRVNWMLEVTDENNRNRLHVSIPEVGWPAGKHLSQPNQFLLLDLLEAQA